MRTATECPSRSIPAEIAPFLATLREAFAPVEVWLFGSRARGDFGAKSDWDMVAVLPDSAAADLLDPVTAWQIARNSPVPVTVLATRVSDLEHIWGLPNTIGYDLSRDGVRLVD